MRRLLVTGLSLLMLIANVSYAHAKPLNIPVVYYKLPNGLKVVISEDHLAPVVAVGVYYNVGFRLEPKGRTGFAHLFEHMMFQGSANVKKFEHAKFVEANGGSLNGHTDFDYTNYYQTLPSNRVELGIWLESDRMRSLDISEENLDDQMALVAPVTKAQLRPERGEEVYGTIREACRIARAGPPGPVFVEVPANLYLTREGAGYAVEAGRGEDDGRGESVEEGAARAPAGGDRHPGGPRPGRGGDRHGDRAAGEGEPATHPRRPAYDGEER